MGCLFEVFEDQLRRGKNMYRDGLYFLVGEKKSPYSIAVKLLGTQDQILN